MRTLRVSRDEVQTLRISKNRWTFLGTLLPYFAMLLGGLLTLAIGVTTRIGIMIQHNAGGTPISESSMLITWFTMFSCLVLTTIAWRLFSQRKGMFIKFHAAVTVMLAHAWLILAIWQDSGDWMFGGPTLYAFFYGSIFVGLSWCIRRWAFRDEDSPSAENVNPFEQAGLGSARIDGYNTHDVPGGRKFRLNLPIGKTIEDAKKARSAIAHIAGKARNLVHISETDSGAEGQVDILVMEENPFKTKSPWKKPEYKGEPITFPITYATYDTGERPELYIAGKNGASSQHFLTMGMPGTGKSKAWQVIYGTVLNRREVSVIFGDPAKAMQTGGPLASGLEWFETTYDGCIAQMEAVKRAIPVRTDYLTSKGLDHWVQGCGINFVIFHLEEAARFAEVDELIELVEAARSAGIAMVISIQRATNDRLKTSARYNLGGNMCFGVKMKRDAAFGLSEYAIASGANPHQFQDRKPGMHFLEVNGVDPRMAGHPLMVDWLDTSLLEHHVDQGDSVRTPLDQHTARALGADYQAYRDQVFSGKTNWQRLRENREKNDWDIQQDEILTQEIPVVKEEEIKKSNLDTPREETQESKEMIRRMIADYKQNDKHTFTTADIAASGLIARKLTWIRDELRLMASEGLVQYDRASRFYRIL